MNLCRGNVVVLPIVFAIFIGLNYSPKLLFNNYYPCPSKWFQSQVVMEIASLENDENGRVQSL